MGKRLAWLVAFCAIGVGGLAGGCGSDASVSGPLDASVATDGDTMGMLGDDASEAVDATSDAITAADGAARDARMSDATTAGDVTIVGKPDASDAATDACFTTIGRLHMTWDPSPDTAVTGYKLYYGTSTGVYTANVDVGLVTDYVITGLTCGTTYFIAATAYDASMLESAFSNEASSLPDCSCTDGGAPADASDGG